FWAGFAWLKLPVADARDLVELAAPISDGRGWECTSPIVPQRGRLPIANLYFPGEQISDLIHILTAVKGKP
ncbi:hypothetical protein ACFQ07_31200, partial [Actinomadura adrarensis]